MTTVCPICILAIVEDDEVMLSCTHNFHSACIVHWIEYRKYKNLKANCPLCRKNIDVCDILIHKFVDWKKIFTQCEFLKYNANVKIIHTELKQKYNVKHPPKGIYVYTFANRTSRIRSGLGGIAF